jgi:hypothetical protein
MNQNSFVSMCTYSGYTSLLCSKVGGYALDYVKELELSIYIKQKVCNSI